MLVNVWYFVTFRKKSRLALPAIQSIGTSVPPFRISQQEHYSILESANGMDREGKLRLQKIYQRSGILYRHSVLEEFSKEDKNNLLFHPSNHHPSLAIGSRMDIYEKYAAALAEEAVIQK